MTRGDADTQDSSCFTFVVTRTRCKTTVAPSVPEAQPNFRPVKSAYLLTHLHTHIQMCINSLHQHLWGPSQYRFPRLGSLARWICLSVFWLDMTHLFWIKHFRGTWQIYIINFMGIHSSVQPWLIPRMSNDVSGSKRYTFKCVHVTLLSCIKM